MKFKMRYIAGGFRVIKNKIFLRNRIYYKNIFQYIGRNCEFSVSRNSKIYIGYKNYFSNYIYIGVHDGGVMKIGNNNFFNRCSTIECLNKIEIGENNLFGPNVIMVDHNHNYSDKEKLICKQGLTSSPIKIGSNIWIGGNVTICKGVTIVDRVVVGANSVVVHDLLEPGVYAGSPARKIKDL